MTLFLPFQMNEISLEEITRLLFLALPEKSIIIKGVASLSHALPYHLTYCDSLKHSEHLKNSLAGACFVTEKLKDYTPPHIIPIVVDKPQHTFIKFTRIIYSKSLTPSQFFAHEGISDLALIHEDAEIEHGTHVDAGAIIGKDVIIGTGSKIGAGAVIGEGVTIGRNSIISPQVTLQYCHIGNNVIIHPGVRIGQDGFGFNYNGIIHEKIPQIGRVIIQDDVEIGANTTIDRGSIRDTVIGDGTKIDNLVQIGHNVNVGRNCIIVAFGALAGSCTLEDNVTLAGNVSVNNGVTIGEKSTIMATSAVKDDIPRNVVYGGQPAKPVRQWFKEIATLEKIAKLENSKGKSDE